MNGVKVSLIVTVLVVFVPSDAVAKQFLCQPTQRIVTNSEGVHVSEVRKRDLFIFDSGTGAFSTNWEGGSSWSTYLRLDPKNSSERSIVGYRFSDVESESNVHFRISIFSTVSDDITFTYDLGGTTYFGFCS